VRSSLRPHPQVLAHYPDVFVRRLAWFLGSALMGLLYDRSLVALVAFSVAAQLASLPLLYIVKRRLTSAARS